MQVEKQITVRCPIEQVFAFVTDMHKVKLWLPVENMRQISNGPIGVGSTFAQDALFMGQRLSATIQVTRYEPPYVFAFKTIQGPIPMSNSIYCARVATTGETRVTLVGEADPGPAMKLLGPFIVPIVKKQLDNQINQLKRALENQA